MLEHGIKTTPVFLHADWEVSWLILPSSTSLLSGGRVQPENTYSRILKVTGQVSESQKRISTVLDFQKNCANLTSRRPAKFCQPSDFFRSTKAFLRHLRGWQNKKFLQRRWLCSPHATPHAPQQIKVRCWSRTSNSYIIWDAKYAINWRMVRNKHRWHKWHWIARKNDISKFVELIFKGELNCLQGCFRKADK